VKKLIHPIWVLILVMILGACTPSAPPTPTAIPTLPATVTPSPVPPPVAMDRFEAGTQMRWLDGSLLVYVPSGDFMMGNADGAHNVHLTGFWIQQTEVTNRMYQDCVLAGVCRIPDTKGELPYNDSRVSSKPITGVDWAQARAYCAWIQGRLPTEAEWERAARGTGDGPYPWGVDQPTCQNADFAGCGSKPDYVTQDSQGANGLGLLGMAGNVAEWVADWYGPGYYLDSPQDNPIGPAAGQARVIRGGSYASNAEQITVYARDYAIPKDTAATLGFRCAVSAPILYPPFCQAPAYMLADEQAASTPVGECTAPQSVIERSRFCQSKVGYVNVDIPVGALYQVTSPGVRCDPAGTYNGMTRLSCYGANNLPVDLTVCSASCYPELTNYNPEPICDPGYRFDAAMSACLYNPAVVSADAETCPDGFLASQLSDGQTACLPLASGLGCPVGQVFDTDLGACRVASSYQSGCQIYGTANTGQASECYQGCPQGYRYDSATQCCRASGDARYPGCQPGYHYDDTQKACLPGSGGLSGEGCVTKSFLTGDCLIQECNRYPDCGLGCFVDKKNHICIPPDPR
jgi:hypothetical protein